MSFSSRYNSLIAGYYADTELTYVARVRNGFMPSLHEVIFKRFLGREKKQCPFINLPQQNHGRGGYGLTVDKMAECRRLTPRLVAQIEYAEWTDADHLRRAKFIALREEKDAREVRRETASSY